MGVRLIARSLLLGTIVALALAQSAGAHGWLPPVDVFTTNTYIGEPHVVLDAEGNATAVWEAWDGENVAIESAYRPASEEWGVATDISEGNGENSKPPEERPAAHPRIAVDADGDVTAVWERNAGDGETVLQADYRPAGGEWQRPVDISAKAPTASADEPWVAADGDGDVTAVYKQQGAIRSSYRPAGGEWQAPITISEPGTEAYTPQAAVDAAGDATAVWMTQVGSQFIARTAYRPAGEGWQPPAALSAMGEGAGDPQIALDAHGDTMVVWQSAGRAVRGVYRLAGGEWGAPSQISLPGEEAESPRLAVDGAGDALVAWGGTRNELDGYEWMASAYRPAGGEWGEPQLLSERGANLFPQSVAFDQEGNAAIAWDRFDGKSDVVQVDYRPAGGEWEAPSSLSDPEAQSFDPVIVLDAEGEDHAAQGDATVVWAHTTGGGCPSEKCGPQESDIQAAGYDQDEAPGEVFEAPTEGVVGEPLSFSAPSVDAFSPAIEFGDGDSASTTSAEHTYEQPGDYTVRFASTELLGYRTSTQRRISISPAAAVSAGEPQAGVSTTTEAAGGTASSPSTGGATGTEAARGALTVHIRLAKQSLHAILARRAVRIVCSTGAAGEWKVRGPGGLTRTVFTAGGQRTLDVALTRAVLRALRQGHSADVRLAITVTSPGRTTVDTTRVLLVRG